MSIKEFYEPSDYVRIQKWHAYGRHGKQTDARIEPAIRMLCVQSGSLWNLQIRGPVGTGPLGLKPGKMDVYAQINMGRLELIALRNHITAVLME